MRQPSLLARSLLAVLFVVCPILFFTDLTRNPYYTQIILLNIFVCLLWIVWLIEAWQTKSFDLYFTVIDIPLLGYIAFCFLSWCNSMVTHRALLSSVYSEGSKGFIFLVVNAYLVYAAALRVGDRALLKRLLWTSYAVATVAAVYGIAQYFGTEWIWPHNLNPYGSRPVSTFGNPNFMSSFLVVILPAMAADLAFGASGAPRFLLLISTLSCFGALIATLTRSSWAGLLVGLTVVGVGTWKMPERKAINTRWVGLMIGAMVALVIFWPKGGAATYSASVFGRLAEIKLIKQGSYGPVFQRFLIWICSWTMVLDHPIAGKGWGTFELFYPFYQGAQLVVPVFKGLRTHANNSHNEILEQWSQVGTVGFGLYILLWVTYFRSAFSIVRRATGPWKAVVLGLLGGAAGMLVDNLLNVSIHFAVPAFFFWWWVGTFYSQDIQAVKTWSFSLKPTWAKGLWGAAVASLMFLIFRAGTLWAGEVHFFEGFKASKGGTDLIRASQELRKAYEWHHLEVNNNYELANVYARLGEKEKALVMYDRALAANAGYDEIYFNRATIEMQMGKVPEAIRDYETSLAINPLSHEAYNALASLYIKDLPKNADQTAALYQKGVLLFPGDKDLWNNLGYLETQRKNWEAAYQAYRKAIVIDPEFDLARRNLSIVAKHLPEHASDPVLQMEKLWTEIEKLGDAGHWEEALRKAQALEVEFPRSFRLKLYAGNSLFQLGRIQEAAQKFEEGTAIRGDVESLWQNLGVARSRLGQADAAKAAFEKALQLDPKNESVRRALGR